MDILAKICLVLDVSANELLDIRLEDEELTLEERQLVQQYRMRPELQGAVKKLLDF